MTQSELNAQNDAPPARVIGGYEIIRELGRGAMGVVYKCHEMTLNRMVAVKLLAPHLAKDESFLKRFKREARAVAQLSHPNVVTIFNIGHHDDSHFIVMEYVKGQVLADMIIERRRLDIPTAVQIARQIALALDAAHRVNIIHRDIKPQNVMVDQMGRAKVMDFGIAKVDEEMHSGLTHTGQVLGTPHYMSPEQLRGESVDGRSDIFALGVTLYEMIAGALPFSGHTAVVVIQKILFEKPRPIMDYHEDFPEPLLRVLDRAMAKNKDDRYASAAEMAQDLQRALTGSDSGALADFEPAPMDLHARQTTFLERFKWAWNHLDTMVIEKARSRWDQFDRKMKITLAAAGGGVILGLALFSLLRSGDETPSDPGPVAAVAVKPPRMPVDATPQPPPNLPPVVTAGVDRTSLRTGESLSLTAAATDAENDPFQLEHRINDGLWESLPAGGITLSALPPGTHTLEVRAADDLGHFSDPWRVVVAVGADRVTEALGLYTGTSGRVDETRARELVIEAAAADPAAKMWLAWFTHWGRCGVARNSEEADALAAQAMDALKLSADSGDPQAQFLLGAALEQGIGIEPDAAVAAEWITRAAEAGDTIAMNYLGYLHVEGRGVPKDQAVAAQWFERGAEAGDVGAMHNLGWMFARGQGVAKDDAKALAWFQRGADLGSARNMGNLGYLYQQGQGVEKSVEEARKWYRLAAASGDETAVKNLKTLGE